MLVNSIAYGWSLLASALCAAAVFSERRRTARDAAENNGEFRRLQRRFVPPYLAVLFAESLQMPYLYVLYRHYAYERSQIGALYVVGLVTCVVAVIAFNLNGRFGRRLLCLLCVGTGSLGCALKFSDNFLALLIGRIFDGIFSALITTPFQAWYTHEHISVFDFPTEWLSSSFSIITIGSGALAIVAGFVAETAETATAVTAFPFAIAILSLVTAGIGIGAVWDENIASEAPVPLKTVVSKMASVVAGRPLLLALSAVSLFADAAVQLTAFVWAPTLIHAKYSEHRLGFGAVYASLVSTSLLGSLFFSSPIMRSVPVSRSLVASLAVASLTLFSAIDLFPINAAWRFDKILIHLIVLHFAIGVYTLAINRLQFDFFPAAHRQPLLALLRVPLTLLASVVILAAFPKIGGERTIVAMASVLLAFPAVMALAVDVFLSLTGRAIPPPLADRFLVPQQPHSMASSALSNEAPGNHSNGASPARSLGEL